MNSGRDKSNQEASGGEDGIITRRNFIKYAGAAAAGAIASKAEKTLGFGRGREAEISPEAMREAIKAGNEYLYKYIQERSSSLDSPTILGPNFDGCYFFRLGQTEEEIYWRHKDGGVVKGFSSEKLAAAKKRLLARNFPRPLEPEMGLLRLTNYQARREAWADRNVIIKHFPGGSEEVEAAEERLYHYEGQPEECLEDFAWAINSPHPPEGIMLSNASYDIEDWPKAELPPSLEDLGPGQIPAALNPVVTSYLRQELGYQGLIMGDWHSTGSIREFARKIDPYFLEKNFSEIEKIKSNPKSFKLYQEAVLRITAFILAVEADVNFIPTRISGTAAASPQDKMISLVWYNFRANSPGLFGEFERKLTDLCLETLNIIRSQKNKSSFSLEDILPLSFNEKLDIISLQNLGVRPETIADPAKREILETVQPFGQWTDPWNRGGVLMLIQRQKIVEELSGKKFKEPPRNTEEEDGWFQSLMSDEEFRSYYDAINWESPSVQEMFKEQKEKVLADYYS